MKTGSMILAILGAIIALPAALLGGLFGAARGAASSAATTTMGMSDTAATNAAVDAAASGAKTYMYLGLLAMVIAIVGAVMVKRPGKVGGGVIGVSAICAGISCASGNPLAYLVTFLLGIATVLGLLGKDAQPTTAGLPRMA